MKSMCVLFLIYFITEISSLKVSQSQEQLWDESENMTIQELAAIGFMVAPAAGPGKRCKDGSGTTAALGSNSQARNVLLASGSNNGHNGFQSAEIAPVVAYHTACSPKAECTPHMAAITCAKTCALIHPALTQCMGFDFRMAKNSSDWVCQFKKTCDLSDGGDAAAATTPFYGGYVFIKKYVQWAKNDPKVRNINGQEFDIMTTGNFQMLSIFEKHEYDQSKMPLLNVEAMIDRAGDRCGATYIQNMTLSGKWAQESNGDNIRIRAVPAVTKAESLEVNLNGDWIHVTAALRKSKSYILKARASEFDIQLSKIKIAVTVDSHRIHEDGVTTNRFANFLNLKLEGADACAGAGYEVAGLLGHDDHYDVEQLPEGCEEKGNHKLMESGQADPSFLSSAIALSEDRTQRPSVLMTYQDNYVSGGAGAA